LEGILSSEMEEEQEVLLSIAEAANAEERRKIRQQKVANMISRMKRHQVILRFLLLTSRNT
jgi:hypothetical protein